MSRADERFFAFIQECGRLLGLSAEESATLLDDPSWFFCFDDGLTPETAVKAYRERDQQIDGC